MQYVHATLTCQSIMADRLSILAHPQDFHGILVPQLHPRRLQTTAQAYLKIWKHFRNPEFDDRRRCARANDEVMFVIY